MAGTDGRSLIVCVFPCVDELFRVQKEVWKPAFCAAGFADVQGLDVGFVGGKPGSERLEETNAFESICDLFFNKLWDILFIEILQKVVDDCTDGQVLNVDTLTC